MDIDFKDIIMEDDIVEILQSKVNILKEKHWKADSCQPDFIISLLYDNNIRDKELSQFIILTCIHMSSSVSSVIFPIHKNFYGYDSLLSAMKNLYNQTM